MKNKQTHDYLLRFVYIFIKTYTIITIIKAPINPKESNEVNSVFILNKNVFIISKSIKNSARIPNACVDFNSIFIPNFFNMNCLSNDTIGFHIAIKKENILLVISFWEVISN